MDTDKASSQEVGGIPPPTSMILKRMTSYGNPDSRSGATPFP